MEEILDEEFKQEKNFYFIVKTILIFAIIKTILDLFNNYFVVPFLPKKIFSSNVDVNQALGLTLMIIVVMVCFFFVKRINLTMKATDEKIIALWGGICIFIGEMLFRIIAFYLIDQTATMKDMGFMIKDSLILSIEAVFFSYFFIKKIRHQDLLIPIILAVGIIYFFDFLYSMNWL